MSYAYHWRKAMTVSVLLHLLMLAAAGYLSAGWATPLPVEEVMLEMDLVNDPTEPLGPPQQAPEAAPETAEPAPAPVPDQPLLSKPEQPEAPVRPVVTASTLTMTEAPAPSLPVSAQPSQNPHPAPVRQETGSGIAAPGILSRTAPAYPPAARKAGQEGTVILKIEILATGRPGNIAIASSSGYSSLDEAAIAAVRKWQFIPAKDLSSNKNVPCTTTLPVSFRLHE